MKPISDVESWVFLFGINNKQEFKRAKHISKEHYWDLLDHFVRWLEFAVIRRK